MITIIVFIPPDGVCQGQKVKLPVGFLKTGERIEIEKGSDNLLNCKLIFLDDTNYANDNDKDYIRVQDGKDALLFQHDSNSNAWEQQEKWLRASGWNPKHFAGFSRTAGFFIDSTRKLLCDNNTDHNTVITVITDLSQWVEGKYVFKCLDNYVAWEIIYCDDFASQRKEAFDSLPKYLRKKLPEEEEPLTKIISVANEIAFKLIQ